MKRKQLFALFLAGVLSIGSVPVTALADEVAVSEEAAGASDPAEEEAAAETDDSAGSGSADAAADEQTAEQQGEETESTDNTKNPEASDSIEAPTDEQTPSETQEQQEAETPAVDQQGDTQEAPVETDPETEVKDEEETPKVTASNANDLASLKTAIAAEPDATDETAYGTPSGFTVVVLTGDIEISETIVIPAGKKVAIITKKDSGSATLKRAAGFKGDLFSVPQGDGDGTILTFLGDEEAALILDGNKTEVADATGSLISVSVTDSAKKARVSISGNVSLENNQTTADGGAITNKGGTLILDGGTIQNNKGKFGAVYTDTDVLIGTGTPADGKVKVIIKDNLNTDDKAGNLVLSQKETKLSLLNKLDDTSVIGLSIPDIDQHEKSVVAKANESLTDEDLKNAAGKISLDEESDYEIDDSGNLNEVTYTLTYESNGGTTVGPKTVKKSELPVTIDAKPTREGYQFDGWYFDNTTFSSKAGSSVTMTADTTLYAKWLREYTLSYETNGGTPAVESQKGIEGTSLTVTTPADLKYDGYRFDGWYLDNTTFSNKAGSTVPMTADTVLYAKWVKQVTLTLNSNEGSGVPASLTVDEGSSVKVSSYKPEREGFVFIGWFTKAQEDNKAKKTDALTTYTVDKDTTLYAAWQRNPIISDVLESTITGLDNVLRFGLRFVPATDSNGNQVKDKNGNLVYTVQGSEAKFVAIGAGQDIVPPVEGDERWVPICWNMDPNKYNASVNANGETVKADRRDEGKSEYTLVMNPRKEAINKYLEAAKNNPALLESPDYFGSASNPKTKAAVFVYFRRQVYENGSWTDKEIKYIKKPIRYYMVLEKSNGTEFTEEEIQHAMATGGGVDTLVNESDPGASTATSTADGARTADESPIGAMSLLLAASFLTGCGVIYRRKRKAEKVRRK